MKAILAIFLTLTCLYASGQNISLGVEVGILRSGLKKGVPIEYHYKYEPVFGIFCNTPITKKLKLNTMLSFSNKGSSFSNIRLADEIPSISLLPRLDYYLYKSLFLYTSPYIGMISKIQKYCKYDIYADGQFSHSIINKAPDDDENFNSIDFGIGAGLGFNYPKNAFFRIGVERGFMNVIQDKPYNYHMTYMATLGYTLFKPTPEEPPKED